VVKLLKRFAGITWLRERQQQATISGRHSIEQSKGDFSLRRLRSK
jgi:hypothetical protein